MSELLINAPGRNLAIEDINRTASGAEFSLDKKCRYYLWRIWDRQAPLLMFIGLNPSTANENDTPKGNDNTITKIKKIAKNNGYGGVIMVNLFPLISSKPSILEAYKEPDREQGWQIVHNSRYIESLQLICKGIVFAWGNFKEAREVSKYWIKRFPDALCIQHNKNGSPKHPLYCLDNSTLTRYKRKEATHE